MKRQLGKTGLRWTLAAAAALALAWTLPAEEFNDLEGSAIKWRTNLKKARAEARRTNRPLLAVFRCVP